MTDTPLMFTPVDSERAMKEWAYSLEGDRQLLELASELGHWPTASIVRYQDSFLLRSPVFRSVDGDRHDTVGRLSLGQSILNAVNPLLALGIDNFRPLIIVGYGYFQGEEWIKVCCLAYGTGSVIPPRSHNTSVVSDLSPDTLLRLAQSDAAVKAVLQVLATRPLSEPEVLYKVLDAVRTDVGGAAGLKRVGLCNAAEFKVVTGTLNHPEILGHQARKVVPKGPRPSRQVSLEQAKLFVRKLVGSWLRSKQGLPPN